LLPASGKQSALCARKTFIFIVAKVLYNTFVDDEHEARILICRSDKGHPPKKLDTEYVTDYEVHFWGVIFCSAREARMLVQKNEKDQSKEVGDGEVLPNPRK
jgi:hypothetical protein